MVWEMEVEEIDAVLEKIWDLHDKLSDAIHSISRTHFLRSVNNNNNNNNNNNSSGFTDSEDNINRTGFVFVKGFPVDDSAVQEAKSLNDIRTALENLEDHLEFFHTVQVQQRAERDAAIARLEQSRIVLALRLGEHHGNKYKVIEEARAFVGDVRDASCFVSPENLFGSAACPSGDNCPPEGGKGSNVLFKVLLSGVNFTKKTIKLNHLNGILGNAAFFAVSMLAMVHLHQVSSKGRCNLHLPQSLEDNIMVRNITKVSRPEGSSSNGHLTLMDVLLARG